MPDDIDDEADPIGWISDQVERFKAYEKRERVLTAPSDEPLSWTDRKTRLVRLDIAILAIHLFALRVGVKSIPGLIRQRVTTTIRYISEDIGRRVVARTISKVAGKFVRQVTLIYEGWLASKAQIELEGAVRRAGIRCQRELYLLKLSQRSKTRRRERVLTRHPIPKQRRPNGKRK